MQEQNDVQFSITQEPGRRAPENGRVGSIYSEPGDLKMSKVRTKDVEFAEDGQEVREDDYKKKQVCACCSQPSLHGTDYFQVFKGATLFWLAYQSTGVIYGDIGTSPLYVYSSTFASEPNKSNLLGVLSLIIWSITLIVTVKYVLIVLCADDQGEGGTFAMYSLLARYVGFNVMQSFNHTDMILEQHRSTGPEDETHHQA